MHPGAKLVLGAVLIVVLPWTLLVFLSLGPVGWLAIATALAAVGLAWMAWDPADAEPPDRVNCPACGAPNEPSAEACRYCGEPDLGSG